MTRNILIIIALIALTTLVSIAQTENCGPQSNGTYVLCSPIPGVDSTVTDISSYITNIYRFVLMIGGIVVFSRIVYGGLKYIFAAGSVSAQSDAKDVITQAIWGLLLLFGAFLVLNTISPNLTKIKEPGSDFIDESSPSDRLKQQLFDVSSLSADQQRIEQQWQKMRSGIKSGFQNDEKNAQYTLNLLKQQRASETDSARIRELDSQIDTAQQSLVKIAQNRISSDLNDVVGRIQYLEGKSGASSDPNAGVWGRISSNSYNFFTSGRFSGLTDEEEKELDYLHTKKDVLSRQLDKLKQGQTNYE